MGNLVYIDLSYWIALTSTKLLLLFMSKWIMIVRYLNSINCMHQNIKSELRFLAFLFPNQSLFYGMLLFLEKKLSLSKKRGFHYFTMVQNRKNYSKNSHQTVHFPFELESERASEQVSAGKCASKVSSAERTIKWALQSKERTDERVVQYLPLYSWLFWTIVYFIVKRGMKMTEMWPTSLVHVIKRQKCGRLKKYLFTLTP